MQCRGPRCSTARTQSEGVLSVKRWWRPFPFVLRLVGLAFGALALSAAPVAAAGPRVITKCSNDGQLQQAAAAGGSYVFAVPCAVTLTKPLTITKSLSLNGAGYRVLITGPTTGSGGRAFTIEGGQVTLTGISFRGQIDGFGASGSPGGSGQPGSNLMGGAMFISSGAHVTVIGNSTSNTLPDVGTLNSSGGLGGDATTAGGNGGGGAAGGDVEGGAAYVSAGGSLTIENAQFDGFISSEGGAGGQGAAAPAPAAQGDGGDGAAAGMAEGGAIYNAGTLTLESARVANSDADSLGGSGGNCCVNGYGGNQSTGGGAAGGDGALSHDALGGGIYNSGTLNLNDATLQFNSATSRGGAGGSTANSGAPGTGAASGNAEGGAIYSTTSLADACVTLGNNTVTSQGGAGGENYTTSNTLGPGPSGQQLGPDIEVAAGKTISSCQTQVSVSDAFVHEPKKGATADANFTVSLNDAASSPVTVHYATKDGSATVAHGDYRDTQGSLTFDPGQATEQTVSVPVHGSGLTKEARFSLVLSAPSGATLNKRSGSARSRPRHWRSRPRSSRMPITARPIPPRWLPRAGPRRTRGGWPMGRCLTDWRLIPSPV